MSSHLLLLHLLDPQILIYLTNKTIFWGQTFLTLQFPYCSKFSLLFSVYFDILFSKLSIWETFYVQNITSVFLVLTFILRKKSWLLVTRYVSCLQCFFLFLFFNTLVFSVGLSLEESIVPPELLQGCLLGGIVLIGLNIHMFLERP